MLLIEALRWFDIFTMFFLLAVKGLLVRPKNFQLWRLLWMIKLQKSPVSCLKLLNWIKSKSLSLVLNISYSPLSRIVSVYFFFWSTLKFAVLKCPSTFSHGLEPSTSRKAVRRPTTQTGGSWEEFIRYSEFNVINGALCKTWNDLNLFFVSYDEKSSILGKELYWNLTAAFLRWGKVVK